MQCAFRQTLATSRTIELSRQPVGHWRQAISSPHDAGAADLQLQQRPVFGAELVRQSDDSVKLKMKDGKVTPGANAGAVCNFFIFSKNPYENQR